MNYESLTIEAKSVLLTFYKAYCQRIKNGESRLDAREFQDFYSIKQTYFADWTNINDLLDAVNELSRQKWLNNEYSNNVPTIIALNTESIAFMQTRFSRGLKQVIDELSKIKSLIFQPYTYQSVAIKSSRLGFHLFVLKLSSPEGINKTQDEVLVGKNRGGR